MKAQMITCFFSYCSNGINTVRVKAVGFVSRNNGELLVKQLRLYYLDFDNGNEVQVKYDKRMFDTVETNAVKALAQKYSTENLIESA